MFTRGRSAMVDEIELLKGHVEQLKAALKEYTQSWSDQADAYNRSEARVRELEAERSLFGTTEIANQGIRDAGGDPVQIGKDGASFVRALEAEKKLRASEVRVRELDQQITDWQHVTGCESVDHFKWQRDAVKP